MKKYIALFLTFAAVASTAQAAVTNTHQIGGSTGVRDQGWNSGVVTNTGVSPAEYSWTFGADTNIYPALSNVAFTVTAVETNDTMGIGTSHLYGTTGNATRLDGNEAIRLTVSYSDPDGLLLALKVDSIGPWWNTGSAEETLFTDGATVFSMKDSNNGDMADYDTTGLTQLTLANTATWSVLAYQTNNLTTSGLGGFKLEYIADIDVVVLPPEPPAGVVELDSTWKKSRSEIIGQAANYVSAVFTNNVAGDNNTNRRVFQDAFAGAPVQVGETMNISFTAIVGDSLIGTNLVPVANGGDRILRASFWDSGATTGNGLSFRADYGAGNYGGTTLQFGLANTQSPGYIGALGASVTTTNKPTNRLANPGDEVDFVLALTRTGETTVDASMSYDDVAVSTNFTGVTNFDSLNAVGFRMNSVLDNHLIITNLVIDITNDTYDWYNHWAFYAGLTNGIDGAADNPDGDNLNNFWEYALNGDPLVATDNWRLNNAHEVVEEGGTNYLQYVYRRRVDAAVRRLNYQVGSGTDLVFGNLTNATEEVGVEAINSTMEYVTNRVSTAVEDKQFMQLNITQE
jgi:hypothetical protein